MVKTLIIAAAVALGATGLAHGQAFTDRSGFTVYGQPRDAYTIRISTLGKDPSAIRREITDAAYTACRLAANPATRVDLTPTHMLWCVTESRQDAWRQLDRIVEYRRGSEIVVAAAGYTTGR